MGEGGSTNKGEKTMQLSYKTLSNREWKTHFLEMMRVSYGK